MADEPQTDQPQHDDTEAAVPDIEDRADLPDDDIDPAGPATPDGDHDTDEDADEDRDDSADDTARGERWRRVTASQANAALLGTLVLAYASRDVRIVVDGDAALRIMKAAESGSAHAWADVLDPVRSPAGVGWVVLAPTQPLAMSWFPGLPDLSHPKAAFDPAV